MDLVSVPYNHRRPPRTHGVVYDLERESHHFQIQGFEYYAKCPLTWRPSLRATGVWFLRPANRAGTISIGHLQRKSSGVADVVVMIKYHLGWTTRSKLVVSGVSHKTHEMVTTELSQIGEGYCTRVIYLGCVHEVSSIMSAGIIGYHKFCAIHSKSKLLLILIWQVFIEGHVAPNAAFVLIDELRIGVGTSRFDGLSEETCD